MAVIRSAAALGWRSSYDEVPRRAGGHHSNPSACSDVLYVRRVGCVPRGAGQFRLAVPHRLLPGGLRPIVTNGSSASGRMPHDSRRREWAACNALLPAGSTVAIVCCHRSRHVR